VLLHADEETLTPVAIVCIAGTLLSTACAQDTPTFNLSFPLALGFSSVLVHFLCVWTPCRQVFSTIAKYVCIKFLHETVGWKNGVDPSL